MASKKDWKIARTDLRKGFAGKLRNPNRMRELDEQIEKVCEKAIRSDNVQTITRKVLEEVANILQHNRSWNQLELQTSFTPQGKTYKFRIRYDGGEYYDPTRLPHVNIGPEISGTFQLVRQAEIETDGTVEIRISITVKD